MSKPKKPLLTKRFEEALQYAAQLHAIQRRKGGGVPYISHLMAVAALVIEAGGGEDEAIAALLHDAVEDQGGMSTLEEIRSRFGDAVAEIVLASSDAFIQPKPPWRERKEGHIERMRQATPEARRVILADKLHNARSLLRDLRLEGDKTWKKFTGGKDGTLWYYRAAFEVLDDGKGGYLVEELERVITDIEKLANN
jgi:(p)ppGpp synthase/HD superfamily hydrolase